MRINWYIPNSETKKFAATCEAAIYNVDNASKYMTEAACEIIYNESQKQVPRDTGALASTGFWEVQRNMGTKRYTYFGVVGYAGMAGSGASRDKPNPKTGEPVSAYAIVVHEDLEASHENPEHKAKFLEDPVRDYGERFFKRVAEQQWGYAIEKANAGVRYTATRYK